MSKLASWKNIAPEFVLPRVGATFRRTRRLPRTLSQRGAKKDQKNTIVLFRKWRAYTKWKWMNMMKVNRTHVQAVYEKILVLHYFRFGAEESFLSISISCILPISYVVIWYKFYSSNKLFLCKTNVLFSIMYNVTTCRIRIIVWGVGAGMELA